MKFPIIFPVAIIIMAATAKATASELDYATQQAYCAGMGAASERFPNSISSQIGLATARAITKAAHDEALINSFNSGYKDAKRFESEIKQQIADDPNSRESIEKEMLLMDQSTACRRNISISKGVLDRISKMNQNEVSKYAIEDLRAWIR